MASSDFLTACLVNPFFLSYPFPVQKERFLSGLDRHVNPSGSLKFSFKACIKVMSPE
jgi:hypothetical protein